MRALIDTEAWLVETEGRGIVSITSRATGLTMTMDAKGANIRDCLNGKTYEDRMNRTAATWARLGEYAGCAWQRVYKSLPPVGGFQ